FFFSSRRRHTRSKRDWSSDVCSSDLDATTGLLLYNFNPIIGTASATYKLDYFPLYTGKFPIRLIGEYMNNPGAPANNQAYRAGRSEERRVGKECRWRWERDGGEKREK